MARYDVIVLGLGAAGSAAAYHLAKRGKKVFGVDRFDPPHRYGSTHGETRVTRAAIGEGVEFTPLAMRSHELWRQIEWETKTHLFNQCGCLFIPSQRPGEVHGVAAEQFFTNVKKSVKKHGVRGRILEHGELRRDYPAFKTSSTDRAFIDYEGGYLMVEQGVAAQLALAKRYGATLVMNTAARLGKARSGVRIVLEDGTTVDAAKLVLTAGAWMPDFVAPLAPERGITVTRQVLHWFEIKSNPERFGPGTPVWIWIVSGLRKAKSDIYGFPWIDSPRNGVKIANEVNAGPVDPDSVSRKVTRREIEEMYEDYVRPFVPDLGPKSLRTEVCLYTNAPQGRFIVDRHPDNANIIYASACSGHGFKHSAALGEALADLAMGRDPQYVDLSGFALKKLPRVPR